MEELIITAAICGAEVTKKHNPAVPYTVEEMVREAKSAFEAGAAVIHVHVRWDDGTPTQDRERFRVVLDAIKAEIQKKDGSLVGKMVSEGTTPRRLTDLTGSLCDLTSGSGDTGTPIVYIPDYFDNHTPV